MNALEVANLSVAIRGAARDYVALDGISFAIARGQTLGLVGESGCGKSLLSLALMGLLPAGVAVTAGSIALAGRELLGVAPAELQQLRGSRIAMIFQEPMTSLNPVLRIGDQIVEAILCHEKIGRAAARARAAKLLELVRMPDVSQRLLAYPHEMSGGMRQRVMIAMALACDPELLIADEPTTALDVTVQGQVLNLLFELQDELKMGLLLISHDLGLVAQGCDELLVMYRGRIIESGKAHELLARPRHPYTNGLLACSPALDSSCAAGPLPTIEGSLPALEEDISGCAFHPRCAHAQEICRQQLPSPKDKVSCFFPLEHASAPAREPSR